MNSMHNLWVLSGTHLQILPKSSDNMHGVLALSEKQ